MNLAQLNQHIDDEHEETIDPAEQIISWFKKTQKRVISPFKRANSTSTTSNRNSVTAGSSSSNPINLIANTLNILQQPEKLISGLQTAGGFVEQSSSSSSKSMHGGNVGTMQGSPAVPTGYSSSGGESDPETGVSRSHWQRETINDFCSIEGCGKSLGLRNGKVNCRK